MNANTGNNEPVHLPPKQKPELEKWAVPVGAAISGGLVAFALPSLIDVSGISGIAKAVLIAGGATLATYSVNRFAIDKGTDLASRGYITAGVASVLSMTFVGAALFTSSFAGLTLPDVEKLRLQEHGNAYVQFIGERSLKASEAGRTLPVMRAISRELPQKAACELKSSCISGRGNGGRGTVTRTLEQLAGRANIIAEQLEAGETTRQQALSQLNKLVGDYQKILGQSDKSIWDRRRDLQKIDAKINQVISDLDEAIPVAFLSAYADELEAGISIPERPVATGRLNALLKKHGQSLNAVLGTVEKGDQTKPVFPNRTGVGDTFGYLSHFAPIALLTAGIELVWPLCLWIYTLLYLMWEKHVADPRPATPSQKGRSHRQKPSNQSRSRHLNGRNNQPGDHS